MGADGSRGPKPFTQFRASTTFLRVPLADWPAVRRGLKTEFRAIAGPNKTPKLWQVDPPTAVVGYTVSGGGTHEAALMVLEAMWQEPLGAISEDSLAAEGMKSLAEFRRYWMKREGRRFEPARVVYVYRVRPWLEGDADILGARLLRRLYGDFLPDYIAERST